MDFILYSLFTEDTPRDPAFALFQDSAAAEFLVAASVNDVREFIRRHWPQVPAPLFAVSGRPFIVRDL
jgi:hypothetical protein